MLATLTMNDILENASNIFLENQSSNTHGLYPDGNSFFFRSGNLSMGFPARVETSIIDRRTARIFVIVPSRPNLEVNAHVIFENATYEAVERLIARMKTKQEKAIAKMK